MSEEIRGRFATIRKFEEVDSAGRLKKTGIIGYIGLECQELMTKEEKEELDEDFVLFYRVAIPIFSSTDMAYVFESYPKFGFIRSNDIKMITIGYKLNSTQVDKILVPPIYLQMMKISFRKYGFPSNPSNDHLRKSWEKIIKETPQDRFEVSEITFGSYDCPLAGEKNGNFSERGDSSHTFTGNRTNAGKTEQKSGKNSDEMEEIDRLKESIERINQNIKVIGGALAFLVFTNLFKIISGVYNSY